MPVYNGATLFPRAIQSILAQTFQDYEIVISDNASADGTADVVEKFQRSDPRIRAFRQPKTISGLFNFRFVWEQARGEFFFWAPHDDWWHPGFIGSAVSALEKSPAASAALGTLHYIGRDGNELGRDQPPYGLDDVNGFRRIRSYLKRNVTDGLYYSVFRKTAMEGAIWSISVSPDKVIIMHLLAKGPIVDGWGMEYFNQYSFKTPEQVLEAFKLPQGGSRFQRQTFLDLLKEMRRAVGPIEFVILAWTLLFRQNWHKIFANLLLEKVRPQSWLGTK